MLNILRNKIKIKIVLFFLLPVSLVSKQVRKQLSMISQTLSSVNMAPSGLSIRVRKTWKFKKVNINIIFVDIRWKKSQSLLSNNIFITNNIQIQLAIVLDFT